jgi:hypothetical protein
MHVYDLIPQYAKMLNNLDRWIEKAVEYAKKKNFDPNVFVEARLAPDQYGFVKQVQSACDSAKFGAAYLSGQKAPVHADTEKTIDELRARIRACLAFLETVTREQCEKGDEAKIAPPWLQGKWMRGDQYMVEASLPNFYFHVTTAYAILRHNGVDLGKMDLIGSLPIRD